MPCGSPPVEGWIFCGTVIVNKKDRVVFPWFQIYKTTPARDTGSATPPQEGNRKATNFP